MQIELKMLAERIKVLEDKLKVLENKESEIREEKTRASSDLDAYKRVYKAESEKQGQRVSLDIIEEKRGRFSNVEYKDAVLSVLEGLKDGNTIHASKIVEELRNGGIKKIKQEMKIYVVTILSRLKEKGLVENLGKNQWRKVREKASLLGSEA